MTAFFNALGSGSPSEVPDASGEDDDASFEKQQQVNIGINLYYNLLPNFYLTFFLIVDGDTVPRERCQRISSSGRSRSEAPATGHVEN